MRCINKMISVVSIASMFLTVQLYPYPTDRYNGVFTREIYQQDEVLQELLPLVAVGERTEDQLHEALVETLYQNKRLQANKKVVAGLNVKLEALIRQKRREKQRQARDGAIDVGVGLLNIVGSLLSFKFGDALKAGAQLAQSSSSPQEPADSTDAQGGGGGRGIGSTLVNGATGARDLATGITRIIDGINGFQSRVDDVFREAERLGIDTIAVAEMKWEREQLLSEIKNELWHEYEAEYVKFKRFLEPELQKSFENKFISARAVGGLGTDQYLGFFRIALAVPGRIKQIGVHPDHDQAARAMLQEFDDHPMLQGYELGVQHELKKLAITALYLSRFIEGQGNQPIRRPYIRRAFYAYGDPGCGKSMGSRTIPSQLLKVPYCEKTILSPSDISQESLLGTPFWGKANPGWLGEALVAKDTEGHSYKNSFLILNDFDRVLMGEDKSALAFLLYLLDPDTKKVDSPLFEGPLDIGNLFIILNGNQRLAQRVEHQGQPQQQGAQQVLPQEGHPPQEGGAAQPQQQDIQQGQAAPLPQQGVPPAEQPFDHFEALNRRLKTVEFGVFPVERRRAIYERQVHSLMSLFCMDNIQLGVQAAAVDDALGQPGLTDGLIQLSEQFTDWKLLRLEGENG